MDTAEFRRIGHRVIDLLADHLDTIEDRPLFPDIAPAAVDALFDAPLPRGPQPAEELLSEVEAKLLANCTQVNHPGYMGLITPSAAPVGALADLIASTINQNIGTYSLGPAAVALERRTVRWLCDLAGYGPEAGGNLTSGGTMANFIGLKLARDAVSRDTAQQRGVEGQGAVYVSDQRHVSVDKAVDAVGLGRQFLRALPTDDAYRVHLEALEEAIARDRSRGVRPVCIVAMAGTTNTGSVDDLARLRSIADREGMWLHADAAYGGGMLLSRRHPGALAGLELADSVTIDPHKWFYAPVDAGAILVRAAERLTRSFGMRPPYLTDEFDPRGERYQYYVHGFEQSRRFRALKVWMAFKRYGADQIGNWIDANLEQARHLARMVAGAPGFRLACPPVMSAVCARFEPPGLRLSEAEIGRIHHRVAQRMEREGRFWFGTTMMKDRWWFRINPVNFRTRLEHMDELFEALRRACAEAAAPLEGGVPA
jgi:glutamate/tyrosine decarboxylase-like PLP-dependent enzyme